ncbi:MAG: hypothetical protein ACREA2_21205 [Blastocatellia bacterium]
MDISWETIKDFIVSFGWAKGTLTILFWVFHAWIYLLYNGRLNDRQKEIDRLIQENQHYRKIFFTLLEQRMGHQNPEISPPETKSLSEKKE